MGRRRKLDLVNRRDLWLEHETSAPAKPFLEDKDFGRTGPPTFGKDPSLKTITYAGMRDDGRKRFQDPSVNPASLMEYEPKTCPKGGMNTIKGSVEKSNRSYSVMQSSIAKNEGYDKDLNPVNKAEHGEHGYTPSFRSPTFNNLLDRTHDVSREDIGRRVEREDVRGADAAFKYTSKRFDLEHENRFKIGPGRYDLGEYHKYMDSSEDKAPALYRSERNMPRHTWMPETVGPGSYKDAHNQLLNSKYIDSPAYTFPKSKQKDKVPWIRKMGPILGPWSDLHREAWKKPVYLSSAPKIPEAKEYHNVTTDAVKTDYGSLALQSKHSPRTYASTFKTVKDISQTQKVPVNCDGPGSYEVPQAMKVHVNEPNKESDYFRRRARNTDVVVYGSNWKSLKPRYEISEAIWNEHMKIDLRHDKVPQRKIKIKKSGHPRTQRSKQRSQTDRTNNSKKTASQSQSLLTTPMMMSSRVVSNSSSMSSLVHLQTR